MSTGQGSEGTLGEFRQFLDFLKSLWAMLAGTSVLFPLSNQFAQVVPLSKWPEGGFVHLTSPVVTGMTTLATLFLILWVFARREQMSRPGAWRSLPTKALTSFAVGFVSLLVYLLIEYLISHDFYFIVLGWESGDLRCILGDFLLLLTYGTCFTLVTRAFLLLGLREYLREKVKHR
jgi:hypothetical protein